jgi:crotonobetainyl-CoA:carnitine CoA-transferase CaiB-like acyl-CoA transferase
VAPVYDIRDIMTDPQYAALGTVGAVQDAELGLIQMQNLLFRLSGTPRAIRWTGRRHGQDTTEVLSELGLSPHQIDALRAEGAA